MVSRQMGESNGVDGFAIFSNLAVSCWDNLVDPGNKGKGLWSLLWHDFGAHDVMLRLEEA
jgi:hypothetical protein